MLADSSLIQTCNPQKFEFRRSDSDFVDSSVSTNDNSSVLESLVKQKNSHRQWDGIKAMLQSWPNERGLQRSSQWSSSSQWSESRARECGIHDQPNSCSTTETNIIRFNFRPQSVYLYPDEVMGSAAAFSPDNIESAPDEIK
eukprot:scaffold93534_cov17-Prasinocladus_malaysianus.AAC.1